MLIWFALIQFASSDHYVSNIEQNCQFLVLFCLPPIWHVVNANIPNFFNMKIIQWRLGRHLWKKTTKGFIFKPLPKVFKLRILSGCWGLVLKVFSILQSLKVCHCFSQLSVWAPWGRPENFLSLHISIFRQYSTISPQLFLKILKNTVTISRYIVFLEHIKSHFLGWSVPRCHFYRPWNVSFKKERNFYLTFSFTKKM